MHGHTRDLMARMDGLLSMGAAMPRLARSISGRPRKAGVGVVISILATLGFLAFTSSAFASVPVWTYAGQNYPNQAAALAAMHAVSPQNALLTQQAGISGIGTATVTYQYIAPTLTATQNPYWYCGYGSPTGCENSGPNGAPYGYSTIAAAINAFAAQYNTGCPYTTSLGAWSPYIETDDYYQPNLLLQIDLATITYNGGMSLPPTYPDCSFPYEGGGGVSRYRTVSCPANYQVSNPGGGVSNSNSISCTASGSDHISYRLLECPNNGSPSTSVGDPCDVTTGDFSQTESDYSGAGLSFQRYYHSSTLESTHALGVGWTHNYAAYLVFSNGVPAGLYRANGHQDALISSSTSGVYISLSGAAIHVQQSGSNWVATLKDGSSEVYNSTGQLIELITPGGLVTTLTYNSNGQLSIVSNPFGQALQFSYNSTTNQLQQLIDPAGNTITYGYNTTTNNLTSVTYQDSTTRTYLYGNSSFPNNLTGIVDESGTQFLTVTYDPTTGAVTSSQQAGGAQAVSIVYNATTAVATDALGAVNTYTFTTDSAYAPRVNAFSRNSLNEAFAVPLGATDPQRRITQSTDYNGNITTFAYDADHLTSKTEASGTPLARTTSYQYLSTLSALPTLITEPLRQTSFSYYSGTNNVQTKTITDTTVTPNVSRTWTYTYNSYGQVLTVDGPRTDVSDVTTLDYYTCTTGNQCGQIQTVTNALGQVTTYNTYNAYAQPLIITDPNGVVTTLTYDARQRVLSRQIGTETTSYSYYPTGLLETVTLPDSSTVTYTYDGAHRLTTITDGLGNYISYTLDDMGNQTATKTYDPSGTLHRSHTQVYNTLNQLYQDVNSAGTSAVTTTFAYDSNGNLTSSDAPLSRNTANQYDALNHLTQVTDPASGVTKFAYDANDQLTSVTDPRSLQTIYTRNGFGDVTQTVSPDTGTSTKTYDSGGNLKTTTDARGAVGTFSYDALNRLTQQAYADQTISFTYDSGANGKGRLTGASDANHSLAWTYDTHGQVTGKALILGTVTKSVGYAYSNDDLTSMVTPGGQTVTYTYANHRITSMAINGTALLSGVAYDPLGPVTGWTWGNSTTDTRSYDEDGRVTQISTVSDPITYSYDNASRITGITDTTTPLLSWTLGYDQLDRLNNAISEVNQSNGTELEIGWAYDANGNRQSQTYASDSTFHFASTDSNQLASITGALTRTYAYDAAGNTLSYGTSVLTYNDRGRLATDTVGNTASSFVYDALGQMVKYTFGTTSTMLMYDEAGHILGEYNSSSGVMMWEYIWMGDIPVAQIVNNGSSVTVYYIHTDQLNAPRKITLPSTNALAWRWDPHPFGEQTPNGNPSGLGTFVNNLRFPGQYYTYESGLNHNGYRDYDPQTGRYIESDPIGLAGGTASTYAYADENPIIRADSSGLFSLRIYDSWVSTTELPQGPAQVGGTGAKPDAACQCTCGNSSWMLVGCTGFIHITVGIRPGLSPDRDAFARHSESQHVLDFANASGRYRQAGESAEQALRSVSFSSQKECQNTSANAVRKALQGVVTTVYGESADRWDGFFGEHNKWW